MKKRINSNRKGKAAELELSKKINELFNCDARRTQQYCGASGDSADITSLFDCHFEVKRVERLNLAEAYGQAKKDASIKGRTPVVCHKKNRQPWMITMALDDLKEFVKKNIHLLTD